MNPTETSAPGSYEPLLNGRLAGLLRSQGLEAKAETRQRGSRKQIDVTVTVEHLVVALEAEIGNRAGALRDADDRLRQAADGEVVTDKALAVVYDPSLTDVDFDSETIISWAVLPREDFVSGTAAELAATLRRLPLEHGDPDRLARDLNAALDQAVAHMPDEQKRQVCAPLDLPTVRVLKGKEHDVTAAAAKRALLVVACASMFHARLDEYLAGETSPDIDARTGGAYHGEWPPKKLVGCVASEDVVGDLHAAWQMILALDYRPIFEAACRVLHAPAQNPRWADSISRVASGALRAARHAAGARHDLLGRIFHWLLDTARYDGSYYTSSAAAALLAGLAIRTGDLPDDLGRWRLIDPACGTGTLLMAAAQRIHDLRGQETADDDAVKLLENVITGLDINTTACHMAATTLGLLSPSTQFRRMRIQRMLFGAQNHAAANQRMLDPRLGSLELLDKKAATEDADGQCRLATDWSSGEHIDTGELLGTDPNSQDLVIMNPPYTRDSLRHDQLPPRIETAMKAREKKLMAGRAGHGSSYGTMFIDLGEHLVSLRDGATFALVYPQAGAAAPSALPIRKLLADWFHIEWVICSHDPERTWFSENTTISEILVVARRHSDEPDRRPATKFARLRRNPRSATDAISLADALASDSEHPDADVSTWPAQYMAQGRWAPLGIASAHLTTIAAAISDGQLFPVVALGDIANVGPAGQRIRDVFTKRTAADAAGRRALWHNDTARTQTLRARPDTYIRAKPNKRSRQLADRYWEQRSNLLLCAKPRLNKCRVVAVWLEETTLGSLWVPVRPLVGDDLHPHDPTQWAKALAVWWNSTLGVISIIAAASPKTLSRPDLSLDAMRSLPVPLTTSEQSKALASVFDRHADEPLNPLSVAETCPARADIDQAVADILGWTGEDIARARRELAREPSVISRA